MSDPPRSSPASADPKGTWATATVQPPRRVSLVWVVPLLAAVLAGWLLFRSWSMRGVLVTIAFEQGHGLKTGDDVRYRGIAVGQVRTIEVTDALDKVLVTVSLHAQAEPLARSGSRFWIVRPRLGLDRVAGLETLVGPRYIASLPGAGVRQFQFVGLHESPVIESINPGDLEVIVQAPARGALRAGGPVSYRQVQIGTVLSVGLSSDGGAVEVRLHIQKPYTSLIKPGTRFWATGGVEARLGLTGFELEMESLEQLLDGGIAVATPPGDFEIVHTGHRFILSEGPEDSWLNWQPMAVVGSELLPPGAALPTPQRATIGWRQGWLIKGQRSRQGWVLQTEAGLLGPADLLEADPDAAADSAVLEVGGVTLPLSGAVAAGPRLAILPVQTEQRPWPSTHVRHPEAPEECLAIGDPAATPLPLAAARLTPAGAVWLVDPALAIDPTWHGAAVLSRRDGLLIGVLLVGEEVVSVGLIEQ